MKDICETTLKVLLKLFNEKRDFGFITKHLENFNKDANRKEIIGLCGLILRNYYLLKHFSEHELGYESTDLKIAFGIYYCELVLRNTNDSKDLTEWFTHFLFLKQEKRDEDAQSKFNKLAKYKKKYVFDDVKKGDDTYFSIHFNLPIWFIKMMFDQNSQYYAYEIIKECANMPDQYVFIPEFIKLDDKSKEDLKEFKQVYSLVYKHKSEKSIKSLNLTRAHLGFPIELAQYDLYTHLPVLKENDEISIYAECRDNVYVEVINKYFRTNKIHFVFNDEKKFAKIKERILLCKELNNVSTHNCKATEMVTYIENKQDLIVYLPSSSSFDSLRRTPDYCIKFDVNSINELAKNQEFNLDYLSKYLNINGYLIYGLNTNNLKETHMQVMKFLEKNKNFEDVRYVMFYPYEKENSIYYYAILRKIR